MSRTAQLTFALGLGGFIALLLVDGPASGEDGKARLSPEARLVSIRRAQVWSATDVAAMDLKVGPDGPGAFAPNDTVTCDYVEKQMNGRSPKFTCRLGKGDEVKVKYGKEN